MRRAGCPCAGSTGMPIRLLVQGVRRMSTSMPKLRVRCDCAMHGAESSRVASDRSHVPGRYVPHRAPSTSLISPTLARARTASMISGISGARSGPASPA